MNTNSQFKPVIISPCGGYDPDLIYAEMKKTASVLGDALEEIRGKKVVIKPNLVTAKAPDTAATTHPAFLRAAVRLIREYGPASLILAESPGGPFTEVALRAIYKTCGISAEAEAIGLPLNYAVGYSEVPAKNGRTCHSFQMIDAIRDADVIVELSKLKTHSLTGMTAAVKNFFGTVPGVLKFEMHARYPEVPDFSSMIVDLCECVGENRTVISFTDAIVAMEGNGPNFGDPRHLGLILTSSSPFVSDIAAARLIGMSPDTLPIAKEAISRGLCPDSAEAISLYSTEGDAAHPVTVSELDRFAVSDFKAPDTRSFLGKLPNFMGGRFAKFFEPRPLVDTEKCVGCGKCVRSCPQKTVVIKNSRGKKLALIKKKDCIRCYCCQELCPHDAVLTHSNILLRMIH